MNTTYSPRTLLAVRRERELVERSIILYRRLRTGTGCECAELFTHAKNRETIAVIKGLVSAYAALKDAVEIPSEFFTTKILLRISMQIMVILQARTRDPIAIFKRIYDREVASQTHLKEKDPYIIHAACVDAHFGFPIATLLCPALNYARYLLKGGVIRRAIAKSIIAAHLDATIHDEHERTRQRIDAVHENGITILSAIGEVFKWTGKLTRLLPKFCQTASQVPISFPTQERALVIWNEYRHHPQVASFGGKERKVSFADVYTFCQHTLNGIGIRNAESFKRAVDAAQRRRRNIRRTEENDLTADSDSESQEIRQE